MAATPAPPMATPGALSPLRQPSGALTAPEALDELQAVACILKDRRRFRPDSAASRQRHIYAAVSQGVPPGRPERPTAEAMLDNMQHRLEHGRSALADCFHQGWPLLTRMRNEGVCVDPGAIRTPGVDTLVSERPAPEAGPPVVNAFDNRGGNGLLWMTSIPAGDFEPAETEGEDGWRELCASRLTMAMDFHFEQIEQQLRSLVSDGLATETDAPFAYAANGGRGHPCLTHSGLVGDDTASVFLHIAATNVRTNRFAAYLQVQSFWHP